MPRLIHLANRQTVQKGDIVSDSHGARFRVMDWEAPHKPASSGFVHVQPVRKRDGMLTQRFYVSVFDMEWIERTDRP